MNWIDYRTKLGLSFSDKAKFKMLKNKLLNFLDILPEVNYGTISYLRYVSLVGERRRDDYLDTLPGIQVSLEDSSSLEDLISKYIAFYNTYLPDDDVYDSAVKKQIIVFLKNSLGELKVGYELIEDADGIFVLPQGVKELDDALVSQPLEWLKDYPQSYKTYCIALRQYSDGVYIRDVADNLRKTLEAFLQEFLNNNKNLETNKNEICKYLGMQGVDPGISGLFQPLIAAYKNINDRIAKHNDQVDKKLLEFLLYQTGVLIRMVLVVKRSETEEQTDAD